MFGRKFAFEKIGMNRIPFLKFFYPNGSSRHPSNPRGSWSCTLGVCSRATSVVTVKWSEVAVPAAVGAGEG